MRVVFCLAVLLCALSAHAGTPGISGEWLYYGNQDGTVRIDEAVGVLEDGTARTSYVLLEEQGPGWRRAAKKGSSHPGDVRKILRVHEDVLLFPGVKNPILVRKGARFTAPREKIRGRWHYARQMNEAFYYDAEFDLDAGKMVEISGHTRNEARPLERLLDAQAELALRADGAVSHFTRLGADFLVLEPSYATSTRNGYKILMERAQAPLKQAKTKKPRQADGQKAVVEPQANSNRGTAKATKAKAKKKGR
jgi:hypothetical protein